MLAIDNYNVYRTSNHDALQDTSCNMRQLLAQFWSNTDRFDPEFSYAYQHDDMKYRIYDV